MNILIVMVLACTCSLAVFVSPNIVVLGGISGVASVAITAFCLIHSHTPIGTFMSVILFLVVFQGTFFLLLYFKANSRYGAGTKKIKRHPIV